jgi:hypothetical protein
LEVLNVPLWTLRTGYRERITVHICAPLGERDLYEKQLLNMWEESHWIAKAVLIFLQFGAW